MRTRLIGAVAVLAIVLGSAAFPSAAPVKAGSTCTGWTSTLVPPTSIRVYRTATKRTETVPFRTYVDKVMAAEWGSRAPGAALRAGAIAAKQFGWYYAIVWRGGKDAAGRCYDVRDSSIDQVYDPGRTVATSIRAAVTATWRISLRKSDRLFLTGYRPGTGSCTANIDGWKLYQRDAVDCVNRYGDATERLARRFFSYVSYVQPGVGDFSGDWRGDVAAVTTVPATGETTAQVLTSDATYRSAVASGSLAGDVLTTVAPDALLGRGRADVNGDGRSDLVQLVQTDDGVALDVMVGTASGLKPAARWWSDAADPFALGAGTFRLVLGDFSGDGRDDAGIVRMRGGSSPSTGLYVAASAGSSFAAVKRRLLLAEDLSAAELRAGDPNGDGLADLLVLAPLETGGTAIRVALAAPSQALEAPKTWITEPLALGAIRAVVGDVTRDGRDDLVVVRKSGEDDLRVIVYRAASLSAAFSRMYFTDVVAQSFAGSRFAASDLTGDGRADLVAFVDRGVDADGNPLGTTVIRFVSSGSAFSRGTWMQTAIPWGSTLPS